MSEREDVLQEFGLAMCDKGDTCDHYDCVGERVMADEIVRLRALPPAPRVVVTEAGDKPVRVLHHEAMTACDEKRWADAVEGEALALARAVRFGVGRQTRVALAKSLAGICAAIHTAALADADAGGVTCAQAFHIAEYIEEEMAERGWDRDELALQMGGEFQVTRLALDLLMEVRTPDVILGEQAEQLARAFGTSAALWRNLHETWRKHPSTPRTPDADAGGDDA